MNSEILYGPPKVGGDVLAWCTKCKLELAHVIAAMLDGKPKRVVCKTCRSQHNYKLQGAPATRSLASRLGTVKVPKTAVRAADYWETKMAERKNDKITPYNVKSVFEKGNIINHTVFGMGLVEEIRGGKIVVTFRVGEKVLVHGMGANS